MKSTGPCNFSTIVPFWGHDYRVIDSNHGAWRCIRWGLTFLSRSELKVGCLKFGRPSLTPDSRLEWVADSYPAVDEAGIHTAWGPKVSRIYWYCRLSPGW